MVYDLPYSFEAGEGSRKNVFEADFAVGLYLAFRAAARKHRVGLPPAAHEKRARWRREKKRAWNHLEAKRMRRDL